MSIILEKTKVFQPIKIKRKDILYWFDVLNEEIFDNVVPFPEKLTIKKLKMEVGWIQQLSHDEDSGIELCILPEYSNIKSFLNVLGHEMVHIWQIQVVGDTGNHNKLFYSWKNRFKKFGLKLERCYER